MMKTTKDLTIISMLKFLLTELEKIIVVSFGSSLKAVAEFTLISNLGSIIARHLYAPVEEVCYNLFAHNNQDEKSENVKG